ncbi:MSP domain protein [Oesophagostomum dentatum]|uniref:Major sperm protein n=1 Tax=Oesophagostomum dentatum TaxID=61180 RepID=A0A0B1SL24_OESDE|nr:MSP domain protein [Oesophagostomum dentatum]
MAEVRKKSSRRKAGAERSMMQAPAAPNIITSGESALAKVTTIPSKSVTFFPNDKRQQTYVVIQNQSDRRVMFKMKSTRPGVYKMKPVFGVVNPGDKSSVRLVFMGIKVGYRIPVNDRITIVLAAVAQKGPADGRALAVGLPK